MSGNGKIGFDDDRGFKNLSKTDGLNLHRLSYFCSQALCPECDGVVRYNFMKEVEGYQEDGGGYYDAQTGEFVPRKKEMFHWDPEFNSVQLKGDVQTKQNTPEGSKCECFCHQRNCSPKSVGRMTVHKYGQKEFAPDIKKKLK